MRNVCSDRGPLAHPIARNETTPAARSALHPGCASNTNPHRKEHSTRSSERFGGSSKLPKVLTGEWDIFELQAKQRRAAMLRGWRQGQSRSGRAQQRLLNHYVRWTGTECKPRDGLCRFQRMSCVFSSHLAAGDRSGNTERCFAGITKLPFGPAKYRVV